MPLILVHVNPEVHDDLPERMSAEIQAAHAGALGRTPDELSRGFHPRQAGELTFGRGNNGVDRRDLVLTPITTENGWEDWYAGR